jgi:hypothetical protein
MFSLLDFGHSKVEVAALEDVKLVDIEFKRHDPHKIVENHLAQFNMKRYVHENSPHDEIFRGVRSYEEVLNRFQTLSPDQQASFLSFQRHRRNSLPKVLQGESIATPPAQESIPPGFEPGNSGKQDIEETPKSSEVLTQELEASLSSPLGPQAIAQLEAFLKQGQDASPSTPATYAANTVEQQQSIEIGTPITSLTPLQSSFGNPSSEVIFVGDLTPILPEEMPPSDFFFSKKQRAIVKRESHQKDGVITKRQRMLYDGNDRDDSEFAKEVAGSLGAFATANQWSVENLAEKLRHKILLVGQLQDQILTMEQTVKNKMSQDFEQIRAYDRHQIQQLRANLEELHRNSQANKGLVTQRDELIRKLQARLDLTEGTSVDISAFQTQALEINEKLEMAQQDLFMKVDAIQKCYQAVDLL